LYRDSGDGITYFPIEAFADVRTLTSPESIMSDVLRLFAGGELKLPVLPEIPQRALMLVNDPLTSVNEIGELISQDQGLSLHVLKVANSALYGGTGDVLDINTACTRLGLKNLTRIVVGLGMQALHRSKDPLAEKTMHAIWEHSIATAFCADKLAPYVREDHQPLLFTAGLLHDIGKTVLLDILFNTYHGRVGVLKTDEQALCAVLDTYHLYMGLFVAQSWGLSGPLRASVLFHEDATDVPGGDWLPFVHVVDLANSLAHLMGYSVGETGGKALVDHRAISYFDFSISELKEAFTTSRGQLEDVIEIYGVGA
jgi:HD-like signal output (HDOD) protein